MNIYFFSHHSPDPKMIEDLGDPITIRFRGEISDIHTRGNSISFTETLFIGGQKLKACHSIPKQSIVIVEAPPILQGDWLVAGISTLLVTQIKQESGPWNSVVFKYCGLLQIHQIEVVTSVWSNGHKVLADSNQQGLEQLGRV